MSNQAPKIPHHLVKVVKNFVRHSYVFFGSMICLFIAFMIASINNLMSIMWFIAPIFIGIGLYCIVKNIRTLKMSPDIKPFLPKPNYKHNNDTRSPSPLRGMYMGTNGLNSGSPLYWF